MNIEIPSELPFAATLEVRGRCLCFRSQRIARSLARRFDAVFRPLGITQGQFSMLMALNRPQPPGMGQLATFLAMDRTTLTAAMKVLERRGLVRRVPDPADARTRALALTSEGHALLIRALPVWRAEHARIDAALDGAAAALDTALAALEPPRDG